MGGMPNSPGDHRTTPESVLEPVRGFLRIDCDPCWNEWSTTAPAMTKYDSTREPRRDGLLNPWTTSPDGCVWVNYPWSSPMPWAKKAVWEKSMAGEAYHILFWGPCYTETVWAKLLYAHASAVCFWGKRVHHPIPVPLLEQENARRALEGKKPLGEGSMWPTQLIYLGPNNGAFLEHFSAYGTVMFPHSA